MAMSEALKATLAAKKMAKAEATVLCRAEPGRFLAAIDFALQSAHRFADAKRHPKAYDLCKFWMMHGDRKMAACRVDHARLRHATEYQLAAMAKHLPFHWVSVQNYSHAHGERFTKLVRVYPLEAILAMLNFLGMDACKYMVAYTNTFVRRRRYHPADAEKYYDMRSGEPEPRD